VKTLLLLRGTAIFRPDAGHSTRTSDGATPLHIAAVLGDVALCKTLLAGGANVGARDHSGAPALMVAARGGNKELVEVLLTADANGETVSPCQCPCFVFLCGH
jgi:hypothetical protein